MANNIVHVVMMKKRLTIASESYILFSEVPHVPICHRMVDFPKTFGIGSKDVQLKLPRAPICHRRLRPSGGFPKDIWDRRWGFSFLVEFGPDLSENKHFFKPSA